MVSPGRAALRRSDRVRRTEGFRESMGRSIICEGDDVYRYRLGAQESDLPLLHTVFHLGTLTKEKGNYPIAVLRLDREDIAELKELLERDEVVTQRPGF